MKRSVLVWLASAAMAVMAIQRTNAASAVAIGAHLRTTRVYGVMFTEAEARQRRTDTTLLDKARRRPKPAAKRGGAILRLSRG